MYRDFASEVLAGQREALGACSACTGDYEDPDRTAWRAEHPADDEDTVEESDCHDSNEFPERIPREGS